MQNAACEPYDPIQSLYFPLALCFLLKPGCTGESPEELKGIRSPTSGISHCLGLSWQEALEVSPEALGSFCRASLAATSGLAVRGRQGAGGPLWPLPPGAQPAAGSPFPRQRCLPQVFPFKYWLSRSPPGLKY